MTNVFNGIVKDVGSVTAMNAVTLDRFQDKAIEEFRKAREHTCNLVKMLTKKDEGKDK